MQGTGTDGRQWIMLVVVCGCVIALINFGVRASFGLFTGPISEANGWGRDVIALALAVQNLLWGAAQPVAGGLADRMRAGAHRRAVDMHRAGATGRDAAAELRADDVEILAQHPQQRLVGECIDLAPLAVDRERDHRSM